MKVKTSSKSVDFQVCSNRVQISSIRKIIVVKMVDIIKKVEPLKMVRFKSTKSIDLSTNQRFMVITIIVTTILAIFIWLYMTGLSFLVDDMVRHLLIPSSNEDYRTSFETNNSTKRRLPIDELRSIIDKSSYLESRKLSDQFLTTFLESRDNDPTKTYDLIDNYFKMRRNQPQLFMNATQSALYVDPPIFNFQTQTTPQNESIVYMKMSNWNYETQNYAQAMATSVPFSEFAVLTKTNRRPAITLVDMSDWSWGHLMASRPSDLRLVFELTERSLPVRPVKMHFCNQGLFFGALLAMARTVMSDTTADSIVLHSEDLSTLYELYPKSILPKPLGGEVSLRQWTHDELISIDRLLVDYWNRFPA